jgi:hypothetical protein
MAEVNSQEGAPSAAIRKCTGDAYIARETKGEPLHDLGGYISVQMHSTSGFCAGLFETSLNADI